MRRALFVMAAAAALGLAVAATPAGAQSNPVELDCGDGTFTVLTAGNGQFTPGRLIGGGGVLIPVSFSDQHTVFTDNDGNVFEDFPPDVVKGNGHPGQGKDLITCDISLTFEDENGSGTFTGTVTGYAVGRGS
jgi:hypothetical protein